MTRFSSAQKSVPARKGACRIHQNAHRQGTRESTDLCHEKEHSAHCPQESRFDFWGVHEDECKNGDIGGLENTIEHQGSELKNSGNRHNGHERKNSEKGCQGNEAAPELGGHQTGNDQKRRNAHRNGDCSNESGHFWRHSTCLQYFWQPIVKAMECCEGEQPHGQNNLDISYPAQCPEDLDHSNGFSGPG